MCKECSLCGRDLASERLKMALYMKDGTEVPICADCIRRIILSFGHLIEAERKKEAANAG